MVDGFGFPFGGFGGFGGSCFHHRRHFGLRRLLIFLLVIATIFTLVGTSI
jgi:hypothetical protein